MTRDFWSIIGAGRWHKGGLGMSASPDIVIRRVKPKATSNEIDDIPSNPPTARPSVSVCQCGTGTSSRPRKRRKRRCRCRHRSSGSQVVGDVCALCIFASSPVFSENSLSSALYVCQSCAKLKAIARRVNGHQRSVLTIFARMPNSAFAPHCCRCAAAKCYRRNVFESYDGPSRNDGTTNQQRRTARDHDRPPTG